MKKIIFGFIKTVTIVAICAVLVSYKGPGEKGGKIHEQAFTIDTHVDTPYRLLDRNFDIGTAHEFEKEASRVDFPRMKKGGLDAAFFAAFTTQRKRTPENIVEARSMADKLIDSIHLACKKHSGLAQVALTVDDGYRLEKEGKRAIYIGLENGFPLGTDLSQVKRYYDKGIRYITLCHSTNNDICDSSTDRNGPEFNGLSRFGEKVVAEMNRLGILVDVSHISDSAFFDVINLSKNPVIASHSCARAVCDNPRNFSDEMLMAIAKNGGVVQMCFLDDYVKSPDTTTFLYKKGEELSDRWYSGNLTKEEEEELWAEWKQLQKDYPKEKPTVANLVDHIDHVVGLIGIDHVGIGTDFDGGGGLKDCKDASEMPNITDELLRRNYSSEDIKKIWGGNFMRVFKETEEFAHRH